ncbi:calcyclin-binding protein, putative [Entamoeba dispar SAW760]|uniref:Calcyclin-binding protein, putative n=1 Tax=Entamoeba dispar (strain ATCC PRA-260 / SAW760) TaxID=370354 RepID=B0EEL0_ENTDS|nr:calcyclin-binding protein, putative [Entamoeba dispar SAW760]EDR26986.1 calcyclin-binding protein, putative [Entamoeba dispar SAW760]|eukprot:EDR26986.1 calcyclin-binding protein, putative [Entamoeba dispar SAW760]
MQTHPFNEIAWEDRTSSVKIMLFLNEIGSFDKSKIKVTFNTDTVDVFVEQFKGVNYHFERKTFAAIIPEQSKYTLSSNRINLILQKEKNESWSSFEKAKDVKVPKMNNKDPQAGLMDMMKQMYEDGDDDMKRTIAKAWSEAHDKKLSGKDSLDEMK